MFGDDFTTELLQQQIDRGRIGPDNLPVYVSSVSYGRILMFSFTSTASITDINATLEAMYNSGEFGGSLSAHLQQVLEQAQIQVVTVGGDANNTPSIFAQRSQRLLRAATTAVYRAADRTPSPPTTHRECQQDDELNLQACVPVDLPATGGNYTIKFTKLKVLDLPDIDRIPEPIVTLWDLELQWTLNVETIVDGIVKVSEYTPTVLHPYATILKEGDWYTFPSNSASDRAIHFDGRDYIRIWGQIRDGTS